MNLRMAPTLSVRAACAGVLIERADDDRDYRRGYADGYAAALDAFVVMLAEPNVDPGNVMKRADDHLLYQIDAWLDDARAVLPPAFGSPLPYAGGRTASTEQEICATRPHYRRGYMDGWDATIERLTQLILYCHTPCTTALDIAVRYLEDQLYPWRTAPEPGRPRVPPTPAACFCAA